MARDKVIQLRVSEWEHARIGELARERGVGTSEYLRGLAIGGVPVEEMPPVTKEEFGAVSRFACPAQPCDFRALSPQARCPVHGRKVIGAP